MNFFTEIAILFGGMTPIVIIFLIVGLILVIIEIFLPGFGFFGIAGSLFLIASIVLRTIVGDGNALAQVFLMLFFIGIIIIAAFATMVVLSKKGLFIRTPLFQKATAVGTDRSDGTKDFGKLVDREGIAFTDLRPVGKAEIDGEIYDVVSGAFYITKGEKIRVTEVEGVKITVVKAG